MHFSWPEVIAALGGQTIFLVAAAWLVRRLVSHGMDRDLTKYKVELKADADREIEKLRSDLRLEVEKLRNSMRMKELEHRVRFSKLHEKRARAIARLYSLMTEAGWVAQDFIFGDTRDRDKAIAAREKGGELYRFFELNRLYLPNSVCIFVERFINKLFHAITAIKVYWTDVEHPTGQMIQQQNEKMLEVLKAFETELPAIKNLLETEFRTLLGAVDQEWMIPVQPDKS